VRAFVRPRGLDVSATRVMADALESLATAEAVEGARSAPLVGKVGFVALRAIARLPAGRRLLLDEREVKAKKRRAQEEQASGAAGIA
jgi:predicted pyridoxine 5'-phosphate oxidase superfamily flavin-nucleotide-binding protein